MLGPRPAALGGLILSKERDYKNGWGGRRNGAVGFSKPLYEAYNLKALRGLYMSPFLSIKANPEPRVS